MEQGSAVFIRHFGTLSFNNVLKDAPTRHARELILVPFYMPADEIKSHMTKKVIKEVEEGTLNTLSSFDRPAHVVYLNPRPIAAVLYLPVAVVTSAITALFTAIQDLVWRDYVVDIEFQDVAVVHFSDRTYKAIFAKNILAAGKLQGDKFLGKVHVDKSIAKKAFNHSIKAMMFDTIKPNDLREEERRVKTKALRDASFDMVSVSSVVSQGPGPV